MEKKGRKKIKGIILETLDPESYFKEPGAVRVKISNFSF